MFQWNFQSVDLLFKVLRKSVQQILRRPLCVSM